MKAKRFCQCGTELERSKTKDGRAARWPKYCSPECQAEAYKINQPTAVYILANAMGEPIYVGVSGNLKQRMIAHKATKDWWESVANIDFEDFTNRLEAEVREAELIKTLKPLHNRAIPIDPTSTPDATDGMNRVLVVFSDGLLSELDSARGLVSRSAWIRRAVENELGRDRVFKATYGTKAFDAMKSKEAVAPLVPEAPKRVWKGTAAEWAAFEEGAGLQPVQRNEPWVRPPVMAEALVPLDFDEAEDFKAEPKPKARRKKSVKDSPAASVGSSKAAQTVSETEIVKVVSPESPSFLPQRCNRGACTGTINPVSGRCLRCNQTPVKESK